MPLRWHGYCRLPVALRQLLAVGRGNASQTQTRCIADIQRPKITLDIRATSYSQNGGPASCKVAVRAHDGGSREPTFSAPQSSSKWYLEAATDHTQHDPRDDRNSNVGGDEAVNEENSSPSRDISSYVEKKRFKFAKQEKGKENRLLVNQLIKDRGYLSYDWRVALELLEQNCEIPDAQTSSTSESPFRKVVPSYDTGGEHPISRPIQRILYRNPQEARLARDIGRPTVWSETILADYIEDLVEYQYHRDSRPRKPQLHNKGTTNVADINSALSEVFHSQSTKRYLSIQAYKTALLFYYGHGLFSKARALYIQMENSGINIPTEIFNLVLRRSASSRDLHNFTFILQKCVQRGFKPDIETWNSFLMTINSSQVRAVIIQRMWGKGILHTLSRKGNDMRLIIQQELGSRVDKHGDRGAFLDHMDDRYGKDWISTSTGNTLLYEFGKRKTMSETLRLLPGMKLRGWRPDEISLDTLLRQSLLLRQHRHAIEILQTFRYHFGIRPGKKAHKTLFLLAHRSRLLNYARVVWASACVCGHTTFKMRNFLFQSLLSSYKAVLPSDGRSERFQKLAGKFMVGVHGSKKVVLPRPDEYPEAQESISRRSIVRSSRMLLQRDLLAARSPFIQEYLEELLLKALELDMEWAATKLLTAADLDEVFQQRIQIQRAGLYSERRPLRIRRLNARRSQKPRALRQASNSDQEKAQSLAQSDRAPPFHKTQVLRRARALKLRRHVVSPEPKSPPPRHARIRRRIAQEARHAQSTDGVNRNLPSLRGVSVRSSFPRSIAGPGQRRPSARLTRGKKSVAPARDTPVKLKPTPPTDAVLSLPSEQLFRPVAPRPPIALFRKTLSSRRVLRKVAARLSRRAPGRKPSVAPAVLKPTAQVGIRQPFVTLSRRKVFGCKHSLLDDAVLYDLPKQVVESVPPQISTLLTKGQGYGSPHYRSLYRDIPTELPSPTTVSNNLTGHIVGEFTADHATHTILIDHQRRKGENLKGVRPLVAPDTPIVPSDTALKRPSIGLISQDSCWQVKRQVSAAPTARGFSSGPMSRRYSSYSSKCVSRVEGEPSLTSAPLTVQKLPTSTHRKQSNRPRDQRPTDSRTQHKPAANDLVGRPLVNHAAQDSVGDHSEEGTTGPPAIRMIPLGETSTRSSNDSNVLKPRAPSMVRKFSSDIERKGLARPLVRKHQVKMVGQDLAARPPIRKHLFDAVGKHPNFRAPAEKPLLYPTDRHSAPSAPVRNPSAKEDLTSGPRFLIRKHAYDKHLAAHAPAEKLLLCLTDIHSAPSAPVRNPSAKKDLTSGPRFLIRKLAYRKHPAARAPAKKPLLYPADKYSAPSAPVRNPSAEKDFTSRPRNIIRKHVTEKPLLDLAEKNPAPSASVRGPSADLVRKDFTSPPRVSIRKHEAVVWDKHHAVSEPRLQSVDADRETLPASVETAQIHSSLDKVLGLNEALAKDAKLAGVKEGTVSRMSIQQVGGTRHLKGLQRPYG